MNKIYVLVIGLVLATCACDMIKEKQRGFTVSSPDKALVVSFYLDENGKPGYTASFREKIAVDSSALGFKLMDGRSLASGFKVVNTATRSEDNTWEQPWGEEREIRDHYNELKVELKNEQGLQMNIFFRAYNGGLGFRYEFPAQESLERFGIVDELTEFNMSDDHQAWWIPAYEGNRYEYIYRKDPISKLKRVHTPLTLETTDGLYLSIHEAALKDFSSMVLKATGHNGLKCALVPWDTRSQLKAYVEVPFKTPWRTV